MKEVSEINIKDGKVGEVFFNPFPGLRPFTVNESHLFFGREGQSDEVLEKLAKNKFAAVIGASGSGKSSLMFCGVIPTLHGGFIAEAGSDWKVIISRPSGGPLKNLGESFTKSNPKFKPLSKEELEIQATITSTILRSSSLGIIEAIKQIERPKDENILLVIDQFEELFRFKRSGDNSDAANESAAFVKMLLEAVKQSELPIYVVLTMRSDFIGDCAQFPELTKMINDSHYLIPQMTREDTRDAIVGPVAVGGGKITSSLVQELLNDVGDDQDQLPILQHALMRTWDYWAKHKEGDEAIDLHHYEAIGKLEKALSLHANECYDDLDDRQKEICESIFKTLTEKGSDNRGVRHPTQVSKLGIIAKANNKDIISVVDNFRKPGRSFLTPAIEHKLTGESIVDISHESLMRVWDRLKSWVDEESSGVQMYLRLSEAAAMYQLGKTSLWRPPDLQLATNWREKQKPTLTWAERHDPAFERAMVFLETSEKAHETEEKNKILMQKRALRRTRMFAIIMVAFTIFALGLALLAQQKQIEADKNAKIAEENAIEAEKQKGLAVLAAEEAVKQEKLALKSAEEAKRQEKLALAALEEAEAQTKIANLQRNRANEALKQAEEARRLADENAAEALKQQKIAEENAIRAQNLRLRAIAKKMAIKSVQLKRDTTQKVLIAMQAYKFNSNHNGKSYDPDIYDGLYYATKALNNQHFNSLEGHEGAVRSLDYSHNGEHLYSACSDGNIFSWDMTVEGQPHHTISKRGDIARSISVSENDKYLIAGFDNPILMLYNIKDTSSAPIELIGHTKRVKQVAFSPNDETFYSVGADSLILKWNVADGSFKEIAKGADTRFNSIFVDENGKWIIAGTESGKVIAYDIENNHNATEIYAGEEPIYAVALSHDGKDVAAGNINGQTRIWDIKTKEEKHLLEGPSARISQIEFAPDNKTIAASSWDKTVRIWNFEDINEEPIVLGDHDDGVFAIAYSVDGSKLIVACKDNLIRIWPTSMDVMAAQICDKIDRNINSIEWVRYVADDIEYEKTCPEYPVGEGTEEFEKERIKKLEATKEEEQE